MASKSAIIVALMASVFATPASAAIWCSGTIGHATLFGNGEVHIQASWRGDDTQICNLSAPWKGVPPEVCAGWMAKLDSAVTFGRTILIMYDTNGTCATLPTYGNAPAPYYVDLG
jgi:hypothetical protein